MSKIGARDLAVPAASKSVRQSTCVARFGCPVNGRAPARSAAQRHQRSDPSAYQRAPRWRWRRVIILASTSGFLPRSRNGAIRHSLCSRFRDYRAWRLFNTVPADAQSHENNDFPYEASNERYTESGSLKQSHYKLETKFSWEEAEQARIPKESASLIIHPEKRRTEFVSPPNFVHSSLSTTQRYIQGDTEAKRKVVDL
jgi:hypothetical protein